MRLIIILLLFPFVTWGQNLFPSKGVRRTTTPNNGKFVDSPSFDAAYLHHWLSATIHFNRYNLCFDKYTECGDKCKPLYFMVLHIRVVPPLFSPFVECPLSDTMCWVIGHFRRYVTERLLNAKVVVFLEFLWFALKFCTKIYDWLE